MDTIFPDTLPDLRPKYKAVVQVIETMINDGALSPGDKLPPIRDFAYRFTITPGTVARAYAILTEQGTTRGEVGRGTFVSAPRPTSKISRKTSELYINSDPQVVDFSSPNISDSGQIQAIKDAMRESADTSPGGFIGYPQHQNYAPLRQAAVTWLSRPQFGTIDAEDITMTQGGQSGLVTILQTILRTPTPRIAIEALSYPGFRAVAELLRADIAPIAIDQQGMLPDALETAATQAPIHAVCLTPDAQNPTAGQMDIQRRRALIEVCERHDIQIIEDDCFRIPNPDHPSLRKLAPHRTWYTTSLSKSLSPALRVGFATAPEGRANELQRNAARSFFGLSWPTAEVARILLERPDITDIAGAAHDLQMARLRDAVNALGSFDVRWNQDVPFLWLTLPAPIRASQFVRETERNGVLVRSAEDFAPQGHPAPNAVRICVNGQISQDASDHGLAVIKETLQNSRNSITA